MMRGQQMAHGGWVVEHRTQLTHRGRTKATRRLDGGVKFVCVEQPNHEATRQEHEKVAEHAITDSQPHSTRRDETRHHAQRKHSKMYRATRMSTTTCDSPTSGVHLLVVLEPPIHMSGGWGGVCLSSGGGIGGVHHSSADVKPHVRMLPHWRVHRRPRIKVGRRWWTHARVRQETKDDRDARFRKRNFQSMQVHQHLAVQVCERKQMKQAKKDGRKEGWKEG